ncbi:hypothetical protein [Stenotrophomonas sp. PD6]|uniref:hypothetical protein n=1 Tax=Stenotrophomonas sp. PD6 TaxID=3368612 RepID=UPI003B9E877C
MPSPSALPTHMRRCAAPALLLLALTPTLFAGDATASAPSERDRAVADADQIAQQLLKVREGETELNCAKAVENARYGVETMLEVGEKNVRGGYLPAEQFNASAAPLRALLPQLTLTDCEAADGNKRAFYQCMSSDYNHVLACGKSHPY